MAATALAVVAVAVGAELATMVMTPSQTVWCSAIRHRVLPVGAVVCWCLGLPTAAWALGLGAATSLALLVGIVAWLVNGKRGLGPLVTAASVTVLLYLVLAELCMPLTLALVHQSGYFVHGRKVRAMRRDP